jgi:transposase
MGYHLPLNCRHFLLRNRSKIKSVINKKYPDEFKQEAVRQVVEKGYSVPDVSKRLGISDKSLYYWVSKAKVPASQSAEQEESLSSKLSLGSSQKSVTS